MSLGARILLALACILCSVGFVTVGKLLGAQAPAGPWPFYGLGAFCALIALACLVRSSRPVALRLIGSIVFIVYAIFAYQCLDDELYSRAILGFFVLGLPGGYVAIWGEYPSWGKGSAAFRSNR